MPLTKPRRRASGRERFNHLDALGGIELKAYVKRSEGDGPPPLRVVAQGACAALASTLPRC